MELTSTAIAASSVRRAAAVIGDRWALRILCDSFAGLRRFEEFQGCSGVPRSTLADRLSGLVERGILERVRYQREPLRYEYRMTAKGADLYGAVLLLQAWEQVWLPPGNGMPKQLRHRNCGHFMCPEMICAACGRTATFENTDYEILPPGRLGRAPVPLFRRFSPAKAELERSADRPIARITDIVGDRWSLLVLSAGLMGLKRFGAIQSALRVSTNILAHRLHRLLEHGVFTRHAYCEHPPRYEYHLTHRGRDLFPAAFMLMQWGDRWLSPASDGSVRVYHRNCGARLRGIVACDRCGESLTPTEVNRPPRPSARPEDDASARC